MRKLIALGILAAAAGCGPSAGDPGSVDWFGRGVMVVASPVTTLDPVGDGAGARGLAATRLSEHAGAEGLRAQARAARSRYFLEAGRKLYEDLRYEQAEKLLERALEIDPSNREAARYLRLTRNVMGVRLDKVRSAMELLINEKRSRGHGGAPDQKEAARTFELLSKSKRSRGALIPLTTSLNRAERLYESAVNLGSGDGARSEHRLAVAIYKLEQATRELSTARGILAGFPYEVDLGSQRDRAAGLRDKVMSLLRRRTAELEALKNEVAAEMRQGGVVERDFERKKTRKLLDQARMLYDHGKHEQCERLAKEILKIDPANAEAGRLRAVARAQKHLKRAMKISETRRDQLIELDERLEEPAVPWRYWLGGLGRELGGNAEERTGALDGGPPGGPAPEPASALRRRITVQFDDTPLEEAVAFFRELLGVAITIDRSVGRAARETPVKLKAVDCEFGPALARMCAALGLAHRIDGKTVVIFRRKGPARAAPGR